MRPYALILLLVLAVPSPGQPGQRFRLRPNAPPVLYGDVLIRRATATGTARAVTFSHWSHRLRYTCRVCHLELDFALVRNATEITEAANRAGEYCGACHDGRTAFACSSEAGCARCHTGALEPDASRFFARIDALPRAQYGNMVDWSGALAHGQIKPAVSLSGEEPPMSLDTTLTLEAEWNFISPAVFPHREHVLWLDCANCHPAIFNVKKKGTHFSMRSALAGRYCGVCHGSVAFPLDDCRRCHPAMKESPVAR